MDERGRVPVGFRCSVLGCKVMRLLEKTPLRYIVGRSPRSGSARTGCRPRVRREALKLNANVTTYKFMETVPS